MKKNRHTSFMGAAALGVQVFLLQLGLCAEQDPWASATVPLDEAKELVSRQNVNLDGYWKIYGTKLFDRRTNTTLAWSVDLVQEPSLHRDGICWADVVRLFDRTEQCRRDNCDSKSAKPGSTELKFAGRSKLNAQCETMQYPDDFFNVKAAITDEDLKRIFDGIAKFQKTNTRCNDITDVARRSGFATSYVVTAICSDERQKTTVSIELQYRDGETKVTSYNYSD